MDRNKTDSGVAWLKLQKIKPYNINADANYKKVPNINIKEEDFNSFQINIMPNLRKTSFKKYSKGRKIFTCKDMKCGASYINPKSLARHCLKHLHISIPVCQYLNDIASYIRATEFKQKISDSNNEDVDKVVFGTRKINKKYKSNIVLDDLNNIGITEIKKEKEDIRNKLIPYHNTCVTSDIDSRNNKELSNNLNSIITSKIITSCIITNIKCENVEIEENLEDNLMEFEPVEKEFDNDSQDSFRDINTTVADIINNLDENLEKDITLSKKAMKVQPATKQSVVNNYKCDYCLCSFNNECKLNIHLEDFHNFENNKDCKKFEHCSQYVSCVYCGFVGHKDNLEEHLEIKHNKISCDFKCPLCKSSELYHSRKNIILHLSVVHDIRLNIPNEVDPISILFLNQKCKVCKAAFLDNCDLKMHLTTNFDCNICNISFDNMLMLTRHMDSKHKSQVKNGNNMRRLVNSFKTNDITKPFVINKNVCTVCAKSFDTITGKYKHMIMKHTNLCSCWQCDEELYTYTEMSRHVDKLHKDNFTGYFCKICDSGAIKDVVSLVRHLRFDHKIPDHVLI